MCPTTEEPAAREGRQIPPPHLVSPGKQSLSFWQVGEQNLSPEDSIHLVSPKLQSLSFSQDTTQKSE